MTAQFESRVLDVGLNEIRCLRGGADRLLAVFVGHKNFGAGNAFSAPSDHSVNGRYVASTNITAPVIYHQSITCERVGIQTNAHRIMTL